jgi:hypothetical protein
MFGRNHAVDLVDPQGPPVMYRDRQIAELPRHLLDHPRLVGADAAHDDGPIYVTAACILADKIVRRADYWTAINRLANALPDRAGTFPGKRVIEIIAVQPWEPGELEEHFSKILASRLPKGSTNYRVGRMPQSS